MKIVFIIAGLFIMLLGFLPFGSPHNPYNDRVIPNLLSPLMTLTGILSFITSLLYCYFGSRLLKIVFVTFFGITAVLFVVLLYIVLQIFRIS